MRMHIFTRYPKDTGAYRHRPENRI